MSSAITDRNQSPPAEPAPLEGEQLQNKPSEVDRDKQKRRAQPAAPRSAFVIFRTAVRQSIRAQNPNLGSEAISKIISVHWRKLSAAEQKPYFEEAEEDKVRYQREVAAYAASLAVVAVVSPKEESPGAAAPVGADGESSRPKRRRIASRRGVNPLFIDSPAEAIPEVKREPASVPPSYASGSVESYSSDDTSPRLDTPKAHGSPRESVVFDFEDQDNEVASLSGKRRKRVGARSHAPGCMCPFHRKGSEGESEEEECAALAQHASASASAGRRMGVHSHGPNCKCKYHCAQRGERWVQKGATAGSPRRQSDAGEGYGSEGSSRQQQQQQRRRRPEGRVWADEERSEAESDVESLVPETDESDQEELEAASLPWGLDTLIAVSSKY